jgi:hypothetical protein
MDVPSPGQAKPASGRGRTFCLDDIDKDQYFCVDGRPLSISQLEAVMLGELVPEPDLADPEPEEDLAGLAEEIMEEPTEEPTFTMPDGV